MKAFSILIYLLLISFQLYSQEKYSFFKKYIPAISKSSVTYGSDKTEPVIHKYGDVLLSEGDVVQGERNGMWKFYSLSDTGVSFTGHYRNGLFDGCWKYYLNKKRSAVIYYKDGKPDSIWKSFYANGKVFSEKYYKNLLPDSIWRTYYDNGNLAKEIYYKNGGWAGKTVTYYSDSQMRSIEMIQEGDTSSTNFKSFYKNGKMRFELNIKNNKPFTTISYFDYNGTPLDDGKLLNGNGTFKEYYDTSAISLYSEIEYKNGKKDGNLTYYNKDGSKAVVGRMVDGKKNGKWKFHDLTIKEDDKFRKRDYEIEYTNDSTSNYSIPNMYCNMPTAHINPEFPKGENELFNFLRRSVIYPKIEKENGVQGKVFITFLIDRDGNLSDISVYKGVKGGPGINQEALRVVRTLPFWSPGLQDGFPVKVRYILPIFFKLQ